MTPDTFCYWLRGFIEMANPKDMSEEQMQMLKKHLDLVFVDVTSEPANEAVAEKEPQVLTDAATDKDDINKRIQDELKKRDRAFWEGRGKVSYDGTSFCSSLGPGGVKVC